MKQPEGVHWLEDAEYQKAKTQLRLNMVGVFDFLKVDDRLPVRYMYGLGEFIEGATDEAVRLAEDFSLRTRGVEKPIDIEIVRKKRMRRKK